MWKRLKELINDRNKQKQYLKWLIGIFKPFRWQIAFLVAVNSLAGITGVVSAFINKQIVDFVQSNYRYTIAVVCSVLCIIISLGTNIVLGILTVKYSEGFACHIRSHLFKHILNSLWEERKEYHSEDLLSRLTSDVELISDGMIQVVVSSAACMIQFLITFRLLYQYDNALAWITILVAFLAVGTNFFFGARLSSVHTNVQQSEAAYRIYLQEQISNADIILAFEQQERSIHHFEDLQKKRMYWIQKRNKYIVLCGTIITTVFSITYLVAFCIGAIKIGKGQITYGTMTVFLSLVGQIQILVYNFGNLLPKLVSVLASAGRAMKISELSQESFKETMTISSGSLDTRNHTSYNKTKIGIVANELTLSYHQEKIVKDFSMDIQPGDKVLLMGVSGIGKTTLIRAILGFIQPDQGSLAFCSSNGEYMNCSKETRCYISYVPQGNTLFMGTIEENLKIGYPYATYEQMRQALEVACAWEFIQDLPEQLQTPIGERGLGLSEGQAQRIAIARALLKPASLFIFDESTSALDEQTEEKVLEHIKHYLKDETCIYISHRSKIKYLVDTVVEIKENGLSRAESEKISAENEIRD